jgi:hypothetical protein
MRSYLLLKHAVKLVPQIKGYIQSFAWLLFCQINWHFQNSSRSCCRLLLCRLERSLILNDFYVHLLYVIPFGVFLTLKLWTSFLALKFFKCCVLVGLLCLVLFKYLVVIRTMVKRTGSQFPLEVAFLIIIYLHGLSVVVAVILLDNSGIFHGLYVL